MKVEVTAGEKGNKARGDCHITYLPDTNRSLEIQVKSREQDADTKAIKKLAENVFDWFGLDHGTVCIDDAGAVDFVLTARLEGCIKQVVDTEKEYLPEMAAANCYQSSKQRLRMSRLFIPGNSPKMIIKGGTYKSHGIILDLEDSVAPEKKAEARLLVRNTLRKVDFYGAERMVRINRLPLGLSDLELVVPHNVHVILIPKCESAEEIQEVNETIRRIQEQNQFKNDIFLAPTIESAKGVLAAEKIAKASSNIVTLTIGLEDYAADIGVKRSKEGTESLYARSYLINVCKAYGIQAVDSGFSDVKDDKGLVETVALSKAFGFSGMSCIHPRQIKIIHEGYAPNDEEIIRAKEIVIAFERAEEQGLGLTTIGGKMIDAPVVKQAQQIIEAAIELGKLSGNWQND